MLQKLRRAKTVLEFLAVLSTHMERHGLGRIILTGGFAVELYTSRAYRTGDVDIIVEGDVRFVRRVLETIGRRVGRVYEIPWLPDKAIDIVATAYLKPRRCVRLKVGENHLYLEPPEEVVTSCLSACKYWRSDLDCEKAIMVLTAQWEHVDLEYLRRRCDEESTSELLEKILELVERSLRDKQGS